MFTQCFDLARRCDVIMVVMKFLWVFKHVYALLLFLSASSMLPLFFRGGGEGAGGRGKGEGAGRDGTGFAGV